MRNENVGRNNKRNYFYLQPLTTTIVVVFADNVLVLGQEMRSRWEMLGVVNGTVSVDTFFCIAGLLTSYLTLKQLRRTGGKMNVPMMYLKRYLRSVAVGVGCESFSCRIKELLYI